VNKSSSKGLNKDDECGMNAYGMITWQKLKAADCAEVLADQPSTFARQTKRLTDCQSFFVVRRQP